MRLRTSFLAAVVALAAVSVLCAQELPVRRYGLFAGANDGGRGRVTLRWAVTDARKVSDVMMELGGIQPQDSYVLVEPTVRDLELQFEHLASRIAHNRDRVRRSEIVFYYSGHSDEYGLMLGEDRLGYVDLRRLIDELGADVSIAILDSCASGAITRLKGGTFTQPFLADEGSQVTGRAFLASSSADEASQESDALGSSFFTHYLVSGLRGAADTSGDGQVTLDEVYHYAREETLQRTIGTFAGPQHASFDFQLTGTGSLVLTSLATLDAAILFDRGLSGRLFVTREHGGIVAEVRKDEGREMRIALPSGTYVVTLQGTDRNYQQRVVLSPGSVMPVTQRDFRVTLLDRTRLRGHEPDPTTLSLSVFPGFELIGHEPYQATISLGLLVGQAYRIRGAQVSSVLSIAREHLTGVQVSGAGNSVGGDLQGFQGAGVFNVAGGNTVALQGAGVFNHVSGQGSGAQVAGVFNRSAAGYHGTQGAGVFNDTDGTLNGAQIAGVFNRAGAVNGAQISPVNVAGAVNGAQVGLVNVGTRVNGVQVGLVNISQQMYGIPIGLVTFVAEGIHNVSIWWEGDQRTWIGVQNGSNIFYTVAYAGYDRGGNWRDLDGLGLGIGAGFRVSRRPFYLDADAGVKRMTDGGSAQERFATVFDSSRGATFPSARVSVGIGVRDGFGWFIGGSFDFARPGVTDAMGYFDGKTNPIALHQGVVAYPTFFTGFRF